jgi:diguanylate cyclase (GGDEF)-like protein
MSFNTMGLPVSMNNSMSSLNDWMAFVEFSTVLLPPLGVLVGVCLIGLFVIGGFWMKGRIPTSWFNRARSMEKSGELSSAYDYVTGLPTRRLFRTLLDQAAGRAAKTGRPLALLVVELEHFRMVAESQGRANGNVVVRVQAARLKGVMRSTETLARLAQDQFAMILDNLTSCQEVEMIAEKLQATVGLPLTLEGHELFLTCRIGVALYPQDAKESESLVKQAMQAVKRAKSEGQAVQFTSPIVAVSPSEVPSMSTPTVGRLP